ncbi:MAG TPA: hypothetical protein VG318_13570 [Actinomycetota bacterium]|nr:hypothetical protein [Actinomycetota bacterium]
MGEATRLDQAVTAMLGVMDDYLPAAAPPLPTPSVSVAGLQERSAGIGGRRGTDFLGGLGVAELKAVRVDALVRYLLWASDVDGAEQQTTDVTERLLTDREALHGKGVLRLTLESVSPADHLAPAQGWRKSVEYRVLYEHVFVDSDGAASLISRIPIDSDVDERDSAAHERSLVTDEMARWAEDVPALVARGRFTVTGLSVLVTDFGPGPAGAVSITRTHDGAAGPPAPYASVDAFLDAVAGDGSPQRHAQLTFPQFPSFEAALDSAGEDVTLGDLDGDGQPDLYRQRRLRIDPPIVLGHPSERLEIAYGDPAFAGVCYVRVEGA